VDPPPVNPRAGLWVGEARIKAVCNATSGAIDPRRPAPAASEFHFPLIVHVDAAGQARLLQQVMQMGSVKSSMKDRRPHDYSES